MTMSKLVYWLIILGAYSVYFVIKSLKSKHNDVKGTPLEGEVFPGIEVYNQKEFGNNEDSSNMPSVEQVSKPVAKKNIVEEKARKAVAGTAQIVGDKDDKASISLKKRSEAKRAFIHAEILNRKY